MEIGLFVFIALLFVIAMVLTLYVFKQEEKKMKRYEEEGVSVEDELKRSHEYETTSVRTYLPIQIILYVAGAIISGLIIVYFLF